MKIILQYLETTLPCNVIYWILMKNSCIGFLLSPRVKTRACVMADKSVLGPFWGLASTDKEKQLRSAKELIILLQKCQVIGIVQIMPTVHTRSHPSTCCTVTGAFGRE